MRSRSLERAIGSTVFTAVTFDYDCCGGLLLRLVFSSYSSVVTAVPSVYDCYGGLLLLFVSLSVLLRVFLTISSSVFTAVMSVYDRCGFSELVISVFLIFSIYNLPSFPYCV